MPDRYRPFTRADGPRLRRVIAAALPQQGPPSKSDHSDAHRVMQAIRDAGFVVVVDTTFTPHQVDE